MRDIRRLSAVVQSCTGAVKLNYEVHGNSIPHLHVHFYPWYPGDAFEDGPIDPKAARTPVYAAGEITGDRSLMKRRRCLARVQLVRMPIVICVDGARPLAHRPN